MLLLRVAVLLSALAAPALGEAPRSDAQPVPASLRPVARDDGGERRCTADGRACIAERSYAADVCRTIELAAGAMALDAGFFARLLWRESLFDAGAVSPAGAQGIAQFMPGTAALRGLEDPFNPAEAILASAHYLKELEGRFGNLGLAAAAYNAGEERVTRFLAGRTGLPGETRAYVFAITGRAVEAWRDGTDPAPPDLALDGRKPFREACLARAEGRDLPRFHPELLPWGVTIAGRDSREAAEAEARRLAGSHAALLGAEQVAYTHERYPGMARARHFAQVGRATRAEAESLCERLRAAGAGCIVRRN